MPLPDSQEDEVGVEVEAESVVLEEPLPMVSMEAALNSTAAVSQQTTLDAWLGRAPAPVFIQASLSSSKGTQSEPLSAHTSGTLFPFQL